MSAPHYVAHCEGCGADRTLTRARVETGRMVTCEPCQRAMTVVNIGSRPKPRRYDPNTSLTLDREAFLNG